MNLHGSEGEGGQRTIVCPFSVTDMLEFQSFSPPSISLVMLVIPKRINWLLKVRFWELVEFCRSPKYWFAIKNSMDSVSFLEAVAPHLLIAVLQLFPLWSPVLMGILSHRRRSTVSQLKNKKMLNPFYYFQFLPSAMVGHWKHYKHSVLVSVI